MKNIILVDDSDVEVEITKMALEKFAPFSTITRLKDGRELIDYLTENEEHLSSKILSRNLTKLILLDINMPRMSGLEALNEIKKNKRLARIPVVMFSNSGLDDDIQKCYNQGANGYIKKPVEFSVLIDHLTTTVNYWLDINLS